MLEGFSELYLLMMAGTWVGLVVLAALFLTLRPWRAKRKLLKVGTKLFLTVWMFLFLLTLLETSFALFYDTTDSFGLVNTSKRWQERHVRLNNLGFRDRKDFSYRTRKGVHRVVLLGDSFAFGHGVKQVSDRFGDQLEQKASELGNVELYNLSIPGASTAGQLKLLSKMQNSSLQFDTVLLCYNLNDVEDLSEDSKYIVGTIILDQPKNILLRETYLPNFLYYRFSQLSRPEVNDYFHWLTDAYQGETWAKQTLQFDRLREHCQANDAALMVVIFPFLHSLDDYKFAEAHTQLLSYWEKHGVPVLDLLPTMKEHAEEGLVVNRYDAHPNPRAHRLAAEQIWDSLLKPHLTQTLRKSDPSP